MTRWPPVFELAILACTALCGCSRWQTASPVARNWLLPPRMAGDGMLIEVAVVQVPENADLLDGELWPAADEQFLPSETRQRLNAAGIRCGRLGGELPHLVRHWLEAQQSSVALEEKDGTALVSPVPTERRIQCRGGRPQYIQVRSQCDRLALPETGKGVRTLFPERPEGGFAEESPAPFSDAAERTAPDPEAGPPASVPTEIVRDASCEWCFKAYPAGDRSVRLELVGGVRHGEPRQRWIAEQGSFRIEQDRPCCRFEETRIEAELIPGQTLLLSAASDAPGLGRLFFGADAKAGWQRQIVLLRLTHSKRDDLFSPPHASTPIVTPAP